MKGQTEAINFYKVEIYFVLDISCFTTFVPIVLILELRFYLYLF